MPTSSPAQHRLMEAAAHTPGGYGGVPQKVGKEFVRQDSETPINTDSDDGLTEMRIAKSIRDGKRDSPQRLDHIWLFDLRVTGTGISYRDSLDEYVYRPPEEYLNDEFLERCQGVPVFFEHPKKGLSTTDEWRNRAIGSLMLPYIPETDDDNHATNEVWAIARIHDGDAAELMQTSHISTSPAVEFATPNSTKKVKTDNGETLLIEGKPSYVDHLGVCPEGVWDKGGEPRGVTITNDK